MTTRNADFFFNKTDPWHEQFGLLRKILLDCGLDEEVKWSKPCYSVDGKNIVIIQGFKEYCALLFFKGALLKDPNNILVKTGPNTQVGRQIRFADSKKIETLKTAITAYLKEAIAIEKAGLKVEVKPAAIKIPDEFKIVLDESPAVRKAFFALTPGRQRAYLYFFSGAKQSATRQARIEKCLPQIKKGIGLNE